MADRSLGLSVAEQYFLRGMKYRLAETEEKIDMNSLPATMQRLISYACRTLHSDLTSPEAFQAAGYIYAMGIRTGRNQVLGAIHPVIKDLSDKTGSSSEGTNWDDLVAGFNI